MLLCERLSVLAGHCVVWLSDSHSLKFWLFVSNLFATPVLVNYTVDTAPRGVSWKNRQQLFTNIFSCFLK